jgi:predicted DNA-binding protein (MmcQ/YjbR family)
MTLDKYNGFCASLPAATHVVQWGGSHVWKVGGKVFAIASGEGGRLGITFKCSDIAYDILKEQPGCRPAPYLASRGMKWIQRTSAESLDSDALKDYLRASHKLVALKLSRKVRRELGLDGLG